MSELIDTVQSRKWIITINNPLEHHFSHEEIRSVLDSVHGASLYWCMCDETGDECETLHTHVFIYRSSPFIVRQIAALFPNMHRDKGFGTAAEIRAYILKDGEKFNKDEHGNYSYTDKTGKLHVGVNHSETFEEYGECPNEHQGKSNSAQLIVSMIQDGASNREIVDTVNSAYKDLDRIDRVRSMYRDAPFKDCWRNLTTTYIFGATGTGKTRSVMEKYGYGNCYRVTDYKHPFDNYQGEDVIIFEEFRSSLKHGDMLIYLDGYPLLLPCRYFNRQACFTKVFLLSNIPLESQYTNIDDASRMAVFRRIHHVIEFYNTGDIKYWGSPADYFRRWGSEIV